MLHAFVEGSEELLADAPAGYTPEHAESVQAASLAEAPVAEGEVSAKKGSSSAGIVLRVATLATLGQNSDNGCDTSAGNATPPELHSGTAPPSAKTSRETAQGAEPQAVSLNEGQSMTVPQAASPAKIPLTEDGVIPLLETPAAEATAPHVSANIMLDGGQPPAATSDVVLASDLQAFQAWVQKDAKSIAVVMPPSEIKPAGPVRPMKKLKSACLDVTDLDNGQDCLDLSAMGTPRKTVTLLRKKKVEAKKKAAKLKDGEVEIDVYEIRLSDRATKELALLEMLPFREFTIDEGGRIEVDESAQDARSARLLSDLPGELSIDELNKGKPSKPQRFNGRTSGRSSPSLASPRMASQDDRPDTPASDHDHLELPDSDGICQVKPKTDVGYQAWRDWQQRQVDLHFIRKGLREQALSGLLSSSIMGVVAAAGGDMGQARGATDRNPLAKLNSLYNLDESLPLGSEPPPSPMAQRRRRAQACSLRNGEGDPGIISQRTGAADRRYNSTCTRLGLQPKPDVLKAVRAIEQGAQSLPSEFSKVGCLGNRGGQAFFLALAADHDNDQAHELQELQNLDLQGHNLGNEAAIALCSMLERCSRLRSVNLARNHISETGAVKLLSGIQDHPHLDSVNIEENPIPSWLRVRFKEVMAGRQDSTYFDSGAKRMFSGTESISPKPDLRKLRSFHEPTT